MEVQFKEEEVSKVVKTSRSSGAVGPNAKVPKLILDMAYDKTDWILDYGSGHKAIHTKMLRKAGYGNTWAHDFVKDSKADGMFVKDLISVKGKWDIIFASNVLNVQVSDEMLSTTLNEIWQLMNPFSIFVANYPKSPRKLGMTIEQLYSKLRAGFRRVCITHSDILVCSRPVHLHKKLKGIRTKENRSLTRLAKLAFLREE